MDPTLIIGVFIGLIALLILAAIIRSIVQAVFNLRQPVLSVRARVVSKRTEIRGGGMNNTSATTTYYVTFEGEGGERQEFSMSGREFGLLAEGDAGMLSRQGTWFKGFQRQGSAIRR